MSAQASVLGAMPAPSDAPGPTPIRRGAHRLAALPDPEPADDNREPEPEPDPEPVGPLATLTRSLLDGTPIHSPADAVARARARDDSLAVAMEDQQPTTSEDGQMADVLEREFRREVIFNHGKNQWHVFNPETGLWLPDIVKDVQERVDQIAVRRIGAAAPMRDVDSLQTVKAFRRLREQSRIESALKALATRKGYKTDGSIFDRDATLLGVQNGVLDLSTLRLHRGEEYGSAVRGMYVSQAAAVAWPEGGEDAAAQSAQPFLDFLTDILGGDPDLVAYVLRLLGYCLIGTTQEEKFWLLVGRGRNGKGTLTKFMHWLLGGYSAFIDSSLYIRSRYGDPGADRARPELGNLWGKRFAPTSEPVKGEFNEQMLKAHTGRDPITFRRMRSDHLWTFEPTHKLFFLSQDAPAVEDVGPSMRGRARVVQFEQSYMGREDRGLIDKLKAIGPGVLVLLAREASAYLRDGLPENARVLGWSDAYITSNDPIGRFLAERTAIDPRGRVAAGTLWNRFDGWCRENDIDPGTQTGFGLKMRTRDGIAKRDKVRIGTQTTAAYDGIRLLDDPSEPPADGLDDQREDGQ